MVIQPDRKGRRLMSLNHNYIKRELSVLLLSKEQTGSLCCNVAAVRNTGSADVRNTGSTDEGV